jgi:hypothetical protein
MTLASEFPSKAVSAKIKNKFMKLYLGRIVSLAAIIVFSVFAAAAQTAEDGKNEVSVWGGYSSDSTTIIRGTGRTEDARFGIFAVRYARRFNNNNAVNLKYTADFIPAAVLNYKNEDPAFSPPVDERRTSYGFGVAPLGLQINFRPRKNYNRSSAQAAGFFISAGAFRTNRERISHTRRTSARASNTACETTAPLLSATSITTSQTAAAA